MSYPARTEGLVNSILKWEKGFCFFVPCYINFHGLFNAEAIFGERKILSEKEKKKERKNYMICGLPHRKRKEKKADKFSGKQTDIIMERVFFFCFCFFSVSEFINSPVYLLNLHWQQQVREKERVTESPFINNTDNLIFQIILSLPHESFVF